MSNPVSPTTGKLFAAYALKAASGDAKSAVSSAASAIARAVFQMAHAGNKTPLIEAAKVAQDLSKKKTAKASGAVAGFLAVIESVDFIDYSEGYIFDKRIGADKAMPRDKAHEIEADCVKAFVAGFDAGMVAHKESVATKKAKDDAASKVAEIEAVTASEIDAAENAINLADKVLVDLATVADVMGIDALIEALTRCPRAAKVVGELGALLSAQKSKSVENKQLETAIAQSKKADADVVRLEAERAEIALMCDMGTLCDGDLVSADNRIKSAKSKASKARKMLESLTA